MTGEQTGRNFWSRWRIAGWGTAATLLVLPAVAMQFTREVQWSVGDFMIAAAMFGVLGLGIELTVRATRNSRYRAGAAVALLTGFLVIWVNGAVGIIGSEENPANLMFFGVIAMAIGGAFLSMFNASGMARTMILAGLGQFAVPFIAIAIWSPPLTADVARTIIFNSVFAGLWLISGWLFRQAEPKAE